MKKNIKIILGLLLIMLFFCVKDLYAYTVTYDQIIKPSFGPQMTMQVKAKDNLLRIESKIGGQEIITIGNDSGTYSYLPSQNIATKVKRSELKENYIKYPEKYLNHIKLFGAKIIGLDIVDGENCQIYSYDDKISGSHVISYVSKTKNLPLKMIITNSFGRSEILFKNLKIGENIPDTTFQVPAGVNIVDTDAILKN